MTDMINKVENSEVLGQHDILDPYDGSSHMILGLKQIECRQGNIQDGRHCPSGVLLRFYRVQLLPDALLPKDFGRKQ